MKLPSTKESFIPGSTKSVFGLKDLDFDMLALWVSFQLRHLGNLAYANPFSVLSRVSF